MVLLKSLFKITCVGDAISKQPTKSATSIGIMQNTQAIHLRTRYLGLLSSRKILTRKSLIMTQSLASHYSSLQEVAPLRSLLSKAELMDGLASVMKKWSGKMLDVSLMVKLWVWTARILVMTFLTKMEIDTASIWFVWLEIQHSDYGLIITISSHNYGN